VKLVDVHCHLESACFAGCLGRVLEDARAAGVAKLITNAITPAQWPESERLAQSHPEIEFALGIHPWYITPGDLSRVEELRDARARGAVAIGEIGLDGKVEAPSMNEQMAVFEAQVRVARDLGLPIIVHCRGAFGDLVRVLKTAGIPEAGGVVHAFSGSVEVVEDLWPFGFSFSLGGSLTYRNSRKRARVLERVYPDRFLLETDSPDIPPVQKRGTGEPNVPANIRYNLAAAAEMLGVTEEEVATASTANACRLFGFEV